jgi:hypothetical protein
MAQRRKCDGPPEFKLITSDRFPANGYCVTVICMVPNTPPHVMSQGALAVMVTVPVPPPKVPVPPVGSVIIVASLENQRAELVISMSA